jgi:hypothetical protein
MDISFFRSVLCRLASVFWTLTPNTYFKISNPQIGASSMLEEAAATPYEK